MKSTLTTINFQEIHVSNVVKGEELIRNWVTVKGKVLGVSRKDPTGDEALVRVNPIWAHSARGIFSDCRFKKSGDSWLKIADLRDKDEITIRGYCEDGLKYVESNPPEERSFGYRYIYLVDCEVINPWPWLIRWFLKRFSPHN